jgi:hypothetical protein
VAAISVLIAIVAVLSVLDPSGWLTRLAGLAGVVLFVMFAIQVYRHYGQNFRPAVDALQPGAWLQLGGGVVLLAGGLVRYRRSRRGRVAPVTDDRIAREAPESASATSPTAVKSPDVERATDSDSERERLEPETTVFRPPAPSEISVGAKGGEGEGRGSEESGGA